MKEERAANLFRAIPESGERKQQKVNKDDGDKVKSEGTERKRMSATAVYGDERRRTKKNVPCICEAS